MRILIATDKFKGSLSAWEACNAIAEGFLRHDAMHEIHIFPLADGGEGTLEILAQFGLGHSFQKVDVVVQDPLFRSIDSYYYLTEKIAFIELSLASGLGLIFPQEANPMNTTTLGTGQLILDAIHKGANEINLFVGGSATNDAGMGIASALGYQFLDASGDVLLPIGANLARVVCIEEHLSVDLSGIKINLLTDVNNPLFGPDGAAFRYARQKGASIPDVQTLDNGLRDFSGLLQSLYGFNSKEEGLGAAGGVGASVVGLLGGVVSSGLEMLLESSQFEEKLGVADLVVTGEGRLDGSSFQGKVVGQVVLLARKHGVPVVAFVGDDSWLDKKERSLEVCSILAKAENVENAILYAEDYLRDLADEFLESYKNS